jgi:hypothetical protein
MQVRSLVNTARVAGAAAPYDTLVLRVFYPAQETIGEPERETGLLPPDTTHVPFPVVIFFSGVNCPAHSYHWLAVELAERGLAVVVFDWVAENLPGRISLTPGIRREALAPERYGTEPSSSALPAILETLQRMNAGGVLVGALDLTRLVLGGHSAGGMMALMNADPRWLPPVVAAFSYCASPLPTLAFGGWPPGVIAPLPSATPLLLLGATEDGIGDLHNHMLGLADQSGADTIVATFEQAVACGRGDAYLAILRGANHHTLCHPRDDTVGRTFADSPAADEHSLRALLASLIGTFITEYVFHQPGPLEDELQSGLIALHRKK